MTDRVNPLKILQWLELGGASIHPSIAHASRHARQCRDISRLISQALPQDWPMACALVDRKLVICVSDPVHSHWLKFHSSSVLKQINEKTDSHYTLSVKTDPDLLRRSPEPQPTFSLPKVSMETRTLLTRTAEQTSHAGLKKELMKLAQSLPLASGTPHRMS